MKRILICEDEDTIREFVVINLKRAGYDVVDVNCGEAALKTFEAERGNFDVVLLDIMMPGIDGFTVCKKIREKSSTIGIIMLTAKDDVSDKVMGLDMGADDYMTKPFAIEELLARIRVALKKHRTDRKSEHEGILKSGKLVLDPASYSVAYNGTPISLTKKEFDLLHYLMAHEGEAVTREQLLSDVWEYDYAGDTNVVDVYIRYLRLKIDEPFHIKTIRTIRAVGYMFRHEETNDEPEQSQDN